MSWSGIAQEVAEAIEGREPTATGYTRIRCPACASNTGKPDSHGAMSVNISNGWFRCWKCDERGRLFGYEDADLPWELPEERAPADCLPVPDEFVPLWEGDGLQARVFAPFRDYLTGRGIAPEVWRSAQLCAAPRGIYAGRVIVPVVVGRQWVAYLGRAIAKQTKPRYKNLSATGLHWDSVLYNHRALSEDRPYVLVVEGVFGALPHGAVATLGKPKGPQIDLLASSGKPIVVCLDGNAWEEGVALAQQLVMRDVLAGVLKLGAEQQPDGVPADAMADACVRALEHPCVPVAV